VQFNAGSRWQWPKVVLYRRNVSFSDFRRPQRHELHQIFRKNQIQRPIQSDSQLLFQFWELAQIDRTPKPPGDKAGKFDSKEEKYK
jgi:hypothetical protein